MALVDTFLAQMEESVPEIQRIWAMDAIVKGTLHWWVMHHVDLQEWAQGGGMYQSTVPTHDQI
jgi:hypothetical protein